jgi:hypothetical protein
MRRAQNGHLNNRLASEVVTPPWRLNIGLSSALIATHLVALEWLPQLNIPTWALLFAMWFVGIVTTPVWALIHEAAHGSLHPWPRANLLAARALSTMFGAPFRALRFARTCVITVTAARAGGGKKFMTPRDKDALQHGCITTYE